MTLAKNISLGVLALIGVGVVVLVAAVAMTAITPARSIGMQQVTAADAEHKPLAVTILYPTSDSPGWTLLGLAVVKLASDGAIEGRGLPVVVMSHGTGGTATSHLDTALALAEAGYVVAAPLHTGDNFQDDSKVGTAEWMLDRARHVARVNDYLLNQWSGRAQLDPGKIGLFGFSAGGTTGLIAIGGTPDLGRTERHCATTPELVCQLLRKGTPLRAPVASEWAHDGRVRAAVIAAPGFGFAFAPDGLSSVEVPVQLWAGGADRNAPPATNAAVVRGLLPTPPEFHLVARAEHFSFMPPCGLLTPLLPPMLCQDPDGFDRHAFHTTFNRDVVAFFNANLGNRSTLKG